jgi:hypothetical protein
VLTFSIADASSETLPKQKRPDPVRGLIGPLVLIRGQRRWPAARRPTSMTIAGLPGNLIESIWFPHQCDLREKAGES